MAEEKKFSAKIWAQDPLYPTVNSYLAKKLPHQVILAARTDYRDHSCYRFSLDYGTYDLKMEDDGIDMKIEHKQPVDDVDGFLHLTSASQEMNSKLVDLALEWKALEWQKSLNPNNDPSKKIIPVHSWEQGWVQRQAVWVASHELSQSQKAVEADVDWFYGNKDFFTERKLPFSRAILVCGPTASGKHWLIRHLAHRHSKLMCYMPVTDQTYPAVGPALACAPMNSIVCVDNLITFFGHVPSSERGVFLRHLETVFNTNVCDKRGVLLVVLAPPQIPPDLERFLLMPQRFQKRFDVSISSPDLQTPLLKDLLPSLSDETREKLAKKCSQSGVPVHVLRWFFANVSKDGKSEAQPDQLAQVVENLAQIVLEERKVIDVAMSGGHRDRMYS